MYFARNTLLISFACCLLSGATVFGFQSDAEKVKKHLEAIKARGEPTTPEELKSKFPIREGAEDVTAIWLEAMEPLSKQAFIDASRNLPIVGVDSKLPLLQSGAVVQECEALVGKYQHSLHKFFEAVEKGGFARFPVDYTKLYLDLPHIKSAHDASRLIRLDLELSARRPDAEHAGKCLRTLFLVSRIFEDEPVFVSQISVFARDHDARSALAEHLFQLRFPENDLRAIQLELRRRNRARELKTALMGERVIDYNAMQDLSLLDENLEKGAHAPDFDILMYLDQMSQRIAAYDLPFPAALTEYARIEETHLKIMSRQSSKRRMVNELFLLTISLAPEMTAQSIAASRAADTGIAIELYRREQGKFPPSLDALVPKYLPTVPMDPFSGKLMLYKLEGIGFTIYSVGKNKTDDGGKLDSKTGDEGLFFPTKTK